jgi:hypothetical protein
MSERLIRQIFEPTAERQRHCTFLSACLRGLGVSWFSRAHGPTVGQVLHGSGVSRDGPRTTVVTGAPTTGVDDRGAATKSERNRRVDVRGGDVWRVESGRAAVTSATAHA